MKITRRQLRRIIREAIERSLGEQVLGYTPPASKDSSDDDSGYETVGSMGVDVDMDDDKSSTQQATAQNVKSLSAQRQQSLDKGDTEAAEESGEQLATARSMRG